MHGTYQRPTGFQRTYDIDTVLELQISKVSFEGEYKGIVLSPPVAVEMSDQDLYELACRNIDDLVSLDE